MTPLQVQWVASSVSALLAGLVAIGATVAIEQLGGMLGGVIAYVSPPSPSHRHFSHQYHDF